MKKNIRISLVNTDLSVTAELLEDINPDCCQKLWENSPHHSPLLHTLVSGKNIYSFVPDITPYWQTDTTLWPRMKSEPGTIFYYTPRTLFIKYGEDSEDYSFPPVARVRHEDMPILQEIGRQAWKNMTSKQKMGCQISYTRIDDIEAKLASVRNRILEKFIFNFADNNLNILANNIIQEIDMIWDKPPAEFMQLYDGKFSLSSNMGSNGQYLSNLFFTEGESNRISNVVNIGAIDNLLRLSQTKKEVNLEILYLFTENLCQPSAKWLGLCGQHKISNFTLEAIKHLKLIKSKEEYFQFFSLFSLYVTRFHSWTVQYFPWYHSKEWIYKAI